MRKNSRPEIALKLKDSGLVPLFYNANSEIVKNVVQACYKGGARFFEFTSRGEFAHEVFADIVKFSRENCPEMIIGAGSVTDAASASLYMSLGAEFVVSPVLREDIAKICNRRKIHYLPGCGTLQEICTAEELGCEIIKLFPASVYGPEFVKAIKGPQPWTFLMPSGGVTTEEDNLRTWFKAGVFCVGMGSSLINKDLIKKADYAGLQRSVEDVLKIISEVKNQ
jgi:2-dehydro-3-deoxyphosphogluconate aldolase / (4S)-4-hydroxy-2-oxoglutarate aldolase